MITFPCAKINLGLNIVGLRDNGYHNLETVFYPIPLHDTLEICEMDDLFPSIDSCDLKTTGSIIEGNEKDNLVLKAYRLLAQDFELPRIHTHLYKHIPSQAGLGGGSSDAAFMIRLLNDHFQPNISSSEMIKYASQLGADCAFFITSEPSYATGIGDELYPIEELKEKLQGYYLSLVKPDVAVSTKEAFAEIECKHPEKCCKDIVLQPIDTWKEELVNDFEGPVFKGYPILRQIKEQLYQQGAAYAAMSGSGSAIYGIFKNKPTDIETCFSDCFTTVLSL